MAFYEYQCNKCGSQFERRVAISDQAKPVTCPSCGSKRVKRKLSLFSTSSGSGSTRSSGDACATGGG